MLGEVVEVVNGRTSSMPSAFETVPVPQTLETMSSRAVVVFGSTSIVVVLPVWVPSVFDGVKLTLYFMVCGVRLVMRMSDWNSESPTPTAWPTIGKISASGGGVPLPTGVTGVTRLIDTGMLPDVVP